MLQITDTQRVDCGEYLVVKIQRVSKLKVTCDLSLPKAEELQHISD